MWHATVAYWNPSTFPALMLKNTETQNTNSGSFTLKFESRKLKWVLISLKHHHILWKCTVYASFAHLSISYWLYFCDGLSLISRSFLDSSAPPFHWRWCSSKVCLSLLAQRLQTNHPPWGLCRPSGSIQVQFLTLVVIWHLWAPCCQFLSKCKDTTWSDEVSLSFWTLVYGTKDAWPRMSVWHVLGP